MVSKSIRVRHIALLAIFGIALGLLTFNFYNTYQHSQYVLQQRRVVVHTLHALIVLTKLEGAIKNASKDHRLYALSGKEVDLAPYQQTILEIENLHKQLFELVGDNPAQLKGELPVREAIQQELTHTVETIAAYQEKRDFSGAANQSLLERLRRTLSRMQQEESSLLAMRTRVMEDSTSEMFVRLVIGWIAFISFLVACMTVIFRAFSARESQQVRQNLTYSAVIAMSKHNDLHAALQELAELFCNRLAFDVAVYWELNEASNELQCAVIYATVPVPNFEAASRHRTFIAGNDLPGRVWQSRAACFIKDVTKDSNFPRASVAAKDHLVSAQAFPIMTGEKFLGVFEFYTTKAHNPDTQLLHMFELVGLDLGKLLERQKAQEKIKESQMRFKAIFDQTYEFIGLMSPDGVLLDSNQTSLNFAGVDLADVVNKPLWETPWWKHSAELQEQLKLAVQDAANGRFVRFEATHPDRNGRLTFVDFSLKPIFDDNGKVVLLIPEARDITEKKEAETRVHEFYSTVSHELRSPLASIRGSLGLIEGGVTGGIPDKTLKLVKIARTEADRLIRLINDILDLRKIEAGMLELKRTDVAAEQLVERTVEGLGGMAHEFGVTLTANVNTNAVMHCDADRLIQALTNLVSNAIKFSPKEGKVLLSVSQHSDSGIRFSVADYGDGIPSDQMHKLFERFQQVDQSDSRKRGGTGLGLAITKAIVKEHGGTIGVESEVGKGSVFWIDLPTDT